MAGEGTSATNIQLVNMLRGRNLEDNVEMLGVVSDIASVYLRADFTVLTSKCESFSNVLLESIASGTPFISSDVGIAEDLLSPDSLVIKGFELPDWVKAMEQKLQARKTHVVSSNVHAFYQKVSDIYAPERIAALYSDCWAKAMGL
jgi:glycosyltransferase involved in cell wall biosynthesis